jgi:hypothetical protein
MTFLFSRVHELCQHTKRTVQETARPGLGQLRPRETPLQPWVNVFRVIVSWRQLVSSLC